MWDQAGEINGEMGLKKVKWQKKERKYWGHTDGHWILLRIEWTHLWKTTVYSPFIERIAILTSCSLCEVEAISDDDWVWGTLWWKNRAHCIHITISHHIGICGSLPLTFAKIEGHAQRKENNANDTIMVHSNQEMWRKSKGCQRGHHHCQMLLWWLTTFSLKCMDNFKENDLFCKWKLKFSLQKFQNTK